jgi:tetratricopeptide (TPR) repeat protein
LARYYYYRGDYDKAEPLFRKAIELFNNETIADSMGVSGAYAGLGAIHFSQNRLKQAKEYFDKAYGLTPYDAAVLQNLASLNVALHDYPAAIRFFQAAMEANPRNEIVYNNLAALYLNLQQYDRAILHAQKAVEIFPKFGEAYINMARAYAGSGMKDKARDAYQKAVQADPTKKDLVETALKQLEAPPTSK